MIAGCFLTQLLSIAKAEGKSPEAILEYFAQRGLAATDPCIDLINALGTDHINRLHKDAGLKVASTFHLMDFQHKDATVMKQIYADMLPQLEACAAIGSPYYMPVTCIAEEHESEAAREECLKVVTEYFGTLTEMAKAYGITIVIENYSRDRTPLTRISDIRHILHQVPDARYVLDTGNFWFAGIDLLEACNTFIDKTVHVHVKDLTESVFGDVDVYGKKADGVAVGSGFLPIQKTLDILRENQYNGALTIETICGRNLKQITQDSLDFIAQFI